MSQKSSLPAARSAVSELPEIHEGEVIGGHYTIQALLARGSSGVVYRAHHQLLGEDIALKLFGNPDSVDNLMAEYVDEYKAQQKIADRTHILNTEAPFTFQWGGLHWLGLPMQLAEMSLRKWMRQADLEDEQVFQQSLTYVHQACLGVEAIHKAGLLHLDLKPENLLLLPTEDKDIPYAVKVADFGLARTLGKQEQRSSLFGDGIGTPAYMAPEQIKAAHWKDVGKPADIYAIGMILYELLDGDLPYSGSAQQIREKKLDASIKIRRPDGEPALVELAMECLHREASQRKASTEAVAEQLRQGLDGYRQWEASKAKAGELLQQAQTAFDKGELEEAKNKLEELRVLAPNHEQAGKLLEQVESRIKELEIEQERKRKEEEERKKQKQKNEQKSKKRKEYKRKKRLVDDCLNRYNLSSVNDTDKYGENILHKLAESIVINEELVEPLVARGADLNKRNYKGNTPLHTATFGYYSDVDKVKVFVEVGADVNKKNNDGNTPLQLAISDPVIDLDIVKILLNAGAETETKDQDGRTPLHYYVRLKSDNDVSIAKKVIHEFIDAKANLNNTINYRGKQVSILDEADNDQIKRLLENHGAKSAEEDNSEIKHSPESRATLRALKSLLGDPEDE